MFLGQSSSTSSATFGAPIDSALHMTFESTKVNVGGDMAREPAGEIIENTNLNITPDYIMNIERAMIAPMNRIMQRDGAAENYEVLPVQVQATGQGLDHHLREQTDLMLSRLEHVGSWLSSTLTSNNLLGGNWRATTGRRDAEHQEARSIRTATSRGRTPVEHGQSQGGMLQERSRTSTRSSESTRTATNGEGARMSTAPSCQRGRAPNLTSSSTTWIMRNGD